MRSFCILIFVYSFLFPTGSMAFNDELTHPTLTEKAIIYSDIKNYLSENLGIDMDHDGFNDKTIQEWLKYGAEMEDAEDICRASNHFHNPALAWDQAGLSDANGLSPDIADLAIINTMQGFLT